MKKILLLFNPLIERRSRRSRRLLRVKQAFRAAGVEVDAQPTSPNHAAGDLVRASLHSGFDAVIVCGGDGTVFDAVQGAAGSSMPIGVLPFGTGNILAQNLCIPGDVIKAVQALVHSRRRSIPLGRILCGFPGDPPRSWFFLFAAGLGMHASLLGASTAWGKHIIGPAAYYAAGLDLLLRGRMAPFEMETTDLAGSVEVRECCEAIGVRVGKLNRWRPGGGLDRESIRIVAVPGRSRSDLARASFQAIVSRGTHASGTSRQGAPIIGDFSKAIFRPIPGHAYSSPIEVEADGEVLGASTATIEMTRDRVILLEPK